MTQATAGEHDDLVETVRRLGKGLRRRRELRLGCAEAERSLDQARRKLSRLRLALRKDHDR